MSPNVYTDMWFWDGMLWTQVSYAMIAHDCVVFYGMRLLTNKPPLKKW